MVPECQEKEVVIVAVFRRSDLVRLHALLACYESPLRTPAEQEERVRDVREMKRCAGT